MELAFAQDLFSISEQNLRASYSANPAGMLPDPNPERDSGASPIVISSRAAIGNVGVAKPDLIQRLAVQANALHVLVVAGSVVRTMTKSFPFFRWMVALSKTGLPMS